MTESGSSMRSAAVYSATGRRAAEPSKCVVMLHGIHEPLSKEEAAISIAPRRFRRLMRWFRLAGYNTLTTMDWLVGVIPARRVLLTFDDAYDSLYQELLPLVVTHRYTPVVFLVVEFIGGTNIWDRAKGFGVRKLLTVEQIREMQKQGVEFGSHSLTHSLLTNASDHQLRCEVGDSKHRLEDLLGVEVNSFAYPFGAVDERVRDAVAQTGYRLAFTTEPGTNFQMDPLLQRRAEVNNSTSIADFLFKLHYGHGVRVTLGAFRKRISGRRLN